MPELPEVEILRRNMDRWFTTRPVAGIEVLDPQLIDRAPLVRDDAAPGTGLHELVGQRLLQARRRAKWLVLDFERSALVAHFRMTGKIVRTPSDVAAPDRPVARLRIDVGSPADTSLWFKDTRRLGRLVVHPSSEAVDAWLDARDIGPEPWPEPVPGEVLLHRAQTLLARARKPRPVRNLLLLERFVAGVGNITACEALWEAGVHPASAAQKLDADVWSRIARAICSHVERTLAAEDGDEVVYVNEPGAGADPLRDRNPFRVYGRAGAPCARCRDAGRDHALETARSAGRSWVFCPRCQARDAP